jgi:hypothetical protein
MVFRIICPEGSGVDQDINVSEMFGIVTDVNLSAAGPQGVDSRRRSNV